MSSEAITKNDLTEILSKIPIAASENMPGIIKMFAGTFAPTGWLLCNGAEVAIEDYPALYDVIQDTYGTASDSDHFVLPDLRGRMALGSSNSHILGSDGGSEYIQAHTHSNTIKAKTPKFTHSISSSNSNVNLLGGGSEQSYGKGGGSGSTYPYKRLSVADHAATDCTMSGSVGAVSGATTGNEGNMPPFLTINYIISTGGVSRWADSAGLPIVRDVTLNGQSVVNNEIAQLPTGNIKRAWLDSDKSTTSGTYTEVCNIELEAGVWIANWGIRFAANSTGVRAGNMNATSGSNSWDIVVPAHGSTTQIRTASILTPSQTTTYYLNAMQNSGSALNLVASGSGYGNFINAVRIA